MRGINSLRSYSSSIILLMAVIGVYVWVSSADMLTDDWWYQHEFDYNSYDAALHGFENCDGPEITTWKQICTSIKNHHLYWNNCRLANALMFASNMVPVWVVDLIHTLMWGLMSLMLLRFVAPNWERRPLLTVCVLWCVWLVLPWHDQMASTDYLMNYVWSTALNLTFLYCLFNSKCQLLTSILALLASLMHEGISMPVSVGLLVWLAVKYYKCQKFGLKNLLSEGRFISIVIYCIGATIVTFGPAFYNRLMVDSSCRATTDLWSIVYKFFLREPIFVVTILVTLFYLIKLGQKSLVETIMRNVVWWTVGITSMSIWIILDGTERQMWIGYVAFIIVNWQMVVTLWRKDSDRQTVVGVILGMIQLVWLIVIASYQQKADSELANVADAMKMSDNEIVYVDTYSPSWLPWWALDIPEHYHGRNPQVRGEHHALHRQGWNDALITLPEDYKDKSLESLPTIEGNAMLKGFMPCFYSSKKYGDATGFARFKVQFSDVPMMEYFNRAYLFYRLPEVAGKFVGKSGVKNVELDFRRVAVAMNECDTLWFYRVHRLGQSLRGCEIVTIDTIRN